MAGEGILSFKASTWALPPTDFRFLVETERLLRALAEISLGRCFVMYGTRVRSEIYRAYQLQMTSILMNKD